MPHIGDTFDYGEWTIIEMEHVHGFGDEVMLERRGTQEIRMGLIRYHRGRPVLFFEVEVHGRWAYPMTFHTTSSPAFF